MLVKYERFILGNWMFNPVREASFWFISIKLSKVILERVAEPPPKMFIPVPVELVIKLFEIGIPVEVSIYIPSVLFSKVTLSIVDEVSGPPMDIPLLQLIIVVLDTALELATSSRYIPLLAQFVIVLFINLKVTDIPDIVLVMPVETLFILQFFTVIKS